MWIQLSWISLLFPCVFLLLQTSTGRCCGFFVYLMQWAASRVSGVSPRVSETVSSSWRWTAPSTRTPPASTSHPAWSCATGRLISEPVPGSWCHRSPAKKHGPLGGYKLVTTWSSTIRMETKGCEYHRLSVTVLPGFDNPLFKLMMGLYWGMNENALSALSVEKMSRNQTVLYLPSRKNAFFFN